VEKRAVHREVTLRAAAEDHVVDHVDVEPCDVGTNGLELHDSTSPTSEADHATDAAKPLAACAGAAADDVRHDRDPGHRRARRGRDAARPLEADHLLPHLEEALRYATTRDERCLGAPAADTLFPVLRHEAFAGCTLVATGEVNVFALRCRNAQAASGRATIEVAGAALTAVLEIKMGGKNMTLAQRVTGTLAGRCP
jgi:hypothetical protein